MFTYLSQATALVITDIEAYFSFVVVAEKSEYTLALGILENQIVTQSVALYQRYVKKSISLVANSALQELLQLVPAFLVTLNAPVIVLTTQSITTYIGFEVLASVPAFVFDDTVRLLEATDVNILPFTIVHSARGSPQRIFPATCNFCIGLVVPIQTSQAKLVFPVLVNVLALASFGYNASLFPSSIVQAVVPKGNVLVALVRSLFVRVATALFLAESLVLSTLSNQRLAFVWSQLFVQLRLVAEIAPVKT